MQQSVLVITVDSRQAERNVKQLDKELANLTNRGETTGRALGSAFSTFTTYAAGFLTVATAINKIDMFTNMQNRLKLVTNGQQELNMAMSDTYRIAQQSYSSWSGVVQVYQRFSDNAKALNINMKQTAQLTETVSKAVAISGASAAAADAALTQFGQALASGVLRGEELNSILEQTPALAKAIAEGMGITVGELRSVAAEGKITGEVLVDALTKSKKSVDELFSKTDITIGQSIEVLTNGVTKFIGEAGRGSGAATALASSIKLLAENISLIADVALAAGIGYITKAIITKTVAVEADIAASISSRNASVAAAQAELAEATAATNAAKAHLANTQATLAETQAKYGATAASVRYTTAQAAVTAATNAQAAAQARLTVATALFSRVGGAALALVGGPIGVLALAIGGAAFAFSALSKRSEEANQKLLETSRYAKLSAEELNNLEGSQKRAAKDDLVKSFDEKNKRLKELGYQFNATVIDMQNYARGNVEVAKISNDVRQGIISQEEAIKRLNKLDLFTGDQIQSAENANQKYR
jgi:tape measure domain-containing protein